MPMRRRTAHAPLALLALLAGCAFSGAHAAEGLVVGTYHVRADKEQCAEGRVFLKDVGNLDQAKEARRGFEADPAFKDRSIDYYKRRGAVIVYRYLARDVYGPSNCTYTRFNSLEARTVDDARRELAERSTKTFKDSFLAPPEIVLTWQGEDIDATPLALQRH